MPVSGANPDQGSPGNQPMTKRFARIDHAENLYAALGPNRYMKLRKS